MCHDFSWQIKSPLKCRRLNKKLFTGRASMKSHVKNYKINGQALSDVKPSSAPRLVNIKNISKFNEQKKHLTTAGWYQAAYQHL